MTYSKNIIVNENEQEFKTLLRQHPIHKKSDSDFNSFKEVRKIIK